MQIVIDIPDEEYKRLTYIDIFKLRGYIENGTPLPKGHGRLIDAKKFRNEFLDSREFEPFKILDMQTTVVEADRGDFIVW